MKPIFPSPYFSYAIRSTILCSIFCRTQITVTIAQSFVPLEQPSRSTVYLNPEAISLADVLPGDEYYDDKEIVFDTEQ
jgi:hypothetical protein